MWQCIACGTDFGSVPQGGDPLGDLHPGKGSEGVPEDVTCPNCGAQDKEKIKKKEDGCC